MDLKAANNTSFNSNNFDSTQKSTMNPADTSESSGSPDPPQDRSSTPDNNTPPNGSPEAGSSNDRPHEAPRMALGAAASRHDLRQQPQESRDVLDNLMVHPSTEGAEQERGEDDLAATVSSSKKPRPQEQMSEKARGKLPVRNTSTPPPEMPNVTPDEHSNSASANGFGLTEEEWEQHGDIIRLLQSEEGYSEDAVKLWIETIRENERAKWRRGVGSAADSSGDDSATERDHGEPEFDEDDIRRAIEASLGKDALEPERGSSSGPSGTDSKRDAEDDSEHNTSRLKRARFTTEGMSEKAKGKLPARDPPTLQRSDAGLSASENPPEYEPMDSSHLTDEQQAVITTVRQDMRNLFQTMRQSGYSEKVMEKSVREILASGFGTGELGAGSAEGGSSSWATDEYGFSEEQIQRAIQLSLGHEEVESGAGPSGAYAHTDLTPARSVPDDFIDEGESEADVPQDFLYYSD